MPLTISGQHTFSHIVGIDIDNIRFNRLLRLYIIGYGNACQRQNRYK